MTLLGLPDIDWGVRLFMGSLVVALIGGYYQPRIRHLLIAFLLGMLWALVTANNQKQQQIKTPQDRIVDAYITNLPVVNGDKVSFKIHLTETDETFLVSHFTGFSHSHDSKTLPNYKPGDAYRFDLSLKPPHSTFNGVGLDRERWLFRHGIDGLATVRTQKPIDSLDTSIAQLVTARINLWRYQIAATIDRDIKSTQAKALFQALSIGDKSRFDAVDYQLFQATGTAHLIAISGLHIAMVAAMGALLGWLLYLIFPQQRLPRPLLQIMVGLLLALTYAGLAGFSVSTQRAFIMLAVYGFFKWQRRSAYAWDVWSLSLLIVLLLDPLNVLDSGFWLSFWAVAVLILAFQGVATQSHKVTQFIKIQWLLLIGMMPLTLLQFGGLKVWAPIVNLLAIPVMTFLLVPVLLLSLIIAAVSGHIPGFFAAYLTTISELFWGCLNYFAQFDVTTLNWPIESTASFVLLTLAAIIVLLPKTVPQRYWALLLIPIALWPSQNNLSIGQFKTDVLDVGQGTAVLISTQNHHLLYDVGARYPSGFNMADAVIMPILKQRHISQIDTVILSHKDNDHAGSYPNLAKQITIAQTFSTDGHYQPCTAGLQWQWDAVTFTVLSPYNLQPYLKNNSSCVVKITSPTTSLLLTGDIEQAVEYRLSHQYPKAIKADVLLIPHHGSNTSSTPEFVAAVNPQIAINSSGAFNQFNHPTSQVKAVYKQLNIEMIDTQDSGRISFTTAILNDEEPTFKRFRQYNPKIWRRH